MRAACLLLLSLIAQSENPLFSTPARAPKHATVVAGASATAAKAGAKISIFVDVTPDAGIHVYTPGAKDFLPIAMNLNPSPAVVAGKTVYPKADVLLFEPLNERVLVFQKPFRLTRELTLARAARAGSTVVVTGSVNYQACDDKVCYAPASVPVSWTLAVN